MEIFKIADIVPAKLTVEYMGAFLRRFIERAEANPKEISFWYVSREVTQQKPALYIQIDGIQGSSDTEHFIVENNGYYAVLTEEQLEGLIKYK